MPATAWPCPGPSATLRARGAGDRHGRTCGRHRESTGRLQRRGRHRYSCRAGVGSLRLPRPCRCVAVLPGAGKCLLVLVTEVLSLVAASGISGFFPIRGGSCCVRMEAVAISPGQGQAAMKHTDSQQPATVTGMDGSAGQSPGRLVLRMPYLLFLGEETNPLKAKTAFGLRDWSAHNCIGQTRLPGGIIDLQLPEMDLATAVQAGARSLVIGVTPVGGRIPEHWSPMLVAAAEAGLDIVSGLHTALESVPGLALAAQRSGTRLVDVRRPPDNLPRATGKRRSGKRVAMVGTDCALGKKYAALALANAMRGQGIDADFRASGQTGIMIAGTGIAVDA